MSALEFTQINLLSIVLDFDDHTKLAFRMTFFIDKLNARFENSAVTII